MPAGLFGLLDLILNFKSRAMSYKIYSLFMLLPSISKKLFW